MFDGSQKPEKLPELPFPPLTEEEMWKRQRNAYAVRALDLEAENAVLKERLAALQSEVASAEAQAAQPE